MMANIKKPEQGLIVIIGCGRLGANIATMFSVRKKDVVIIDKDGDAFRKLPSEYSGFTVEADATDIDALKKTEIDNAGILVAVTDNDNVNIMVSQMARVIFDVPKVVARLYDADKEKINSEYSIHTIYPTKLSMEAFEHLLDNQEEAVK
jgi:trk system potassium uptake protein TrkA